MMNRIIFGVSACLITVEVFAQTCNTSMVQSTPTTRFTSQGDGLVLDTKTNLIWKQCLEGQTWDGGNCIGNASAYTWQQALNLSQASWRLPNVKELSSIVEHSCRYPSINLTIFPNTTSSFFWSSSPSVNINNKAWSIVAGSSTLLLKNYSYNARVRLVRNGQ